MSSKSRLINPYMVTSIAPREGLPVLIFYHSQYSSINCMLRTSICICCIFVALHLQNKSSGIRAYIVLCCRMDDYPDINNFVKIIVKYVARLLCMRCRWRNIHAGKEVSRAVMRYTAGVTPWRRFGVNRFHNRTSWHHKHCSASTED